MAFSTGGRINTNIGANQAYGALNSISRELGVHQLRLATGKRINSAADDASGYVISKKMEGRMRSMSAALDNVGDAQSVYGVAEGAYQTVADILTTIKEKQTRAANGAMGGEEKDAIASEINSLMNEINDISNQTKFNGTALLSGSFSIDIPGRRRYDRHIVRHVHLHRRERIARCCSRFGHLGEHLLADGRYRSDHGQHRDRKDRRECESPPDQGIESHHGDHEHRSSKEPHSGC
jgi:flagellin-like hook-associated protein FlgL